MSFAIIARPELNNVAAVEAVETPSQYEIEYAAARQKEISDAIYQQIGGGRFRIMTGANVFMRIEIGLRIKFPNKAAGAPNMVDIVLDPSDTYNLTFSRVRGNTVKTTSQHDGIYCDMLQDLFTAETGLYTHF